MAISFSINIILDRLKSTELLATMLPQNRVKHCFANAIVGFEDVLIWSVKRTGLDHSTVHRIFRMEGVVLYPCSEGGSGCLT